MQHCLSGPCVSFLVQCDLQGVLVIYCCITNFPHIQQLEATSVYYLTFLLGVRNPGAGQLWLRIPHEVVVMLFAGTIVI